MTEPARMPVVAGVLKRGQIVSMGGIPLRVVLVETQGNLEWATFRPLTSRELWWQAHRDTGRIILALALAVGGIIATAIALSGCRYEQRAIEQGGGLECQYSGANVCGGKFHLSGSCSDALDLTGTWRLCRDSDGVQCTLTSTKGTAR